MNKLCFVYRVVTAFTFYGDNILAVDYELRTSFTHQFY